MGEPDPNIIGSKNEPIKTVATLPPPTPVLNFKKEKRNVDRNSPLLSQSDRRIIAGKNCLK
jgi:hypothetical protein